MINKDDIVILKSCGNDDRDLMCAGFKAVVISVSGGHAFVDSDKAGVRQASSFKVYWPLDKLTIAA